MKLKYRLRARHPRVFNLLWSVKKTTRYYGAVSKKMLCLSKKTHKEEQEADVNLVPILEVAKLHGLFDEGYYSEHQCANFSNELEAFSDFMHKSRFSNVNPSPAFDTEAYFKHNIDVYYDGANPLEHYLMHGRFEGRGCVPACPRWAPNDDIKIKLDATYVASRIAVCLHIFYEDFVSFFKQCLEDFPVSIDLFITASSEEIESRALLLFKQLTVVQNLKVKVVPNRGRNFGPLLVEYSKELMSYDLVCHLHSKKSLYSGRTQTQWAEYLAEYLIRDKHLVKNIISEFDTNPECGIFYPTSFWMMPDWVNHWLKNKHFASEYVSKWSIETKGNFLCYPVGGMFWARPKALYQLLETNHEYNDFPDEPLPTDGSELHALERVLGVLAESNGFKQLFYYPPLGRFTYDKTWALSNYVHPMESICRMTKDVKIVSFDVFDTLVQREYFVPDYAKLKLGKHLKHIDLTDDAISYVQIRNNAEYSIRAQRHFKGDVSIYEVYRVIAEDFGWSEEEANSYAEMEFAFDLDMLQPKSEMVSLANQLIDDDVEVWVISDTYYSAGQVALILKKAGLATDHKLFVSSDMGYRKDNGQMWVEIAKKLKSRDITDMASYLHIGDNVVADAQIPGDMGLRSLHILNPIDKWQAGGFDYPSEAFESLNETAILKWGPLITRFGRYPFLGE